MSDRLLTTAEAAERLGLSPRVLEAWRLKGGCGYGLVFRKLGRRAVRYHPADIDRFVADSARINTGGAMPE